MNIVRRTRVRRSSKPQSGATTEGASTLAAYAHQCNKGDPHVGFSRRRFAECRRRRVIAMGIVTPAREDRRHMVAAYQCNNGGDSLVEAWPGERCARVGQAKIRAPNAEPVGSFEKVRARYSAAYPPPFHRS